MRPLPASPAQFSDTRNISALQVSLGKGAGLPGENPLPSRNAIKRGLCQNQVTVARSWAPPKPADSRSPGASSRSLSDSATGLTLSLRLSSWSFLCQPGSCALDSAPGRKSLTPHLCAPVSPTVPAYSELGNEWLESWLEPDSVDLPWLLLHTVPQEWAGPFSLAPALELHIWGPCLGSLDPRHRRKHDL